METCIGIDMMGVEKLDFLVIISLSKLRMKLFFSHCFLFTLLSLSDSAREREVDVLESIIHDSLGLDRGSHSVEAVGAPPPTPPQLFPSTPLSHLEQLICGITIRISQQHSVYTLSI